MTDIVERLRFKKKLETIEDVHALFADAADEIERLREALRFYAGPEGYTFLPMVKADGTFFISSIVVRDGGEKARSALEEKE